jgi:hypothetical protein
VEHERSWVPPFLDRLDDTSTQRVQQDRDRLKENMLPSAYVHHNVFLGFQADALGIQQRDIISVDQLLWGADDSHVESTFPRSRQSIEESRAECTEEEQAKIAGGNATWIDHLGGAGVSAPQGIAGLYALYCSR